MSDIKDLLRHEYLHALGHVIADILAGHTEPQQSHYCCIVQPPDALFKADGSEFDTAFVFLSEVHAGNGHINMQECCLSVEDVEAFQSMSARSEKDPHIRSILGVAFFMSSWFHQSNVLNAALEDGSDEEGIYILESKELWKAIEAPIRELFAAMLAGRETITVAPFTNIPLPVWTYIDAPADKVPDIRPKEEINDAEATLDRTQTGTG
ncbi:hypothetical protein [Pseudoruegeria sp. HB172150]|uniref:hypothetical protein n=1 Tax=Pseudoruegeria sp. HB172150 TaxID=2721164 RepID=UPI0015571354|nr:hypothetical protein [Pseudoruegeria sp. HB172150]